MIEPQEIRQKADNLYPAYVQAWLRDEAGTFFPRTIPSRKTPPRETHVARAWISRLRNESKETRGFGYSVEWSDINSRDHGRNQFPTRIVFETATDFLKFTERETEFATLTAAVSLVRAKRPELEAWIRTHTRELCEIADEIGGLLHVVDYLRTSPRPGRFARELPLPVDTKFIERNRRVLREWLDIVLSPQTITADEAHFERRFGLRYAEPLILVRFLDPSIQQACKSPWPELALPLGSLAALELQGVVRNVLVVENKVNLLTLPDLPKTIALGGIGNGVVDLRYVPWIAKCDLYYWGDIDVDGFAILARLRNAFPHVKSLMMDDQTVREWRGTIGGPGGRSKMKIPTSLTEVERAAFGMCAEQNLRIEQERLPQEYVKDVLIRRMRG